jgi:hypothetical protein
MFDPGPSEPALRETLSFDDGAVVEVWVVEVVVEVVEELAAAYATQGAAASEKATSAAARASNSRVAGRECEVAGPLA